MDNVRNILVAIDLGESSKRAFVEAKELAVDSALGNERDPGVKEMLRQAVEGARRNGRHSGICGQAPSGYPKMAEYLVRLGIGSISLNPDTVVKTTLRVIELEKTLDRKRRIA